MRGAYKLISQTFVGRLIIIVAVLMIPSPDLLAIDPLLRIAPASSAPGPYLFSAHLWTDAVTDAKDDLLVRAHNLLH